MSNSQSRAQLAVQKDIVPARRCRVHVALHHCIRRDSHWCSILHDDSIRMLADEYLPVVDKNKNNLTFKSDLNNAKHASRSGYFLKFWGYLRSTQLSFRWMHRDHLWWPHLQPPNTVPSVAWLVSAVWTNFSWVTVSHHRDTLAAWLISNALDETALWRTMTRLISANVMLSPTMYILSAK